MEQTESMIVTLHLRQLHLHVGKNVEKSSDGVPQSAVSETLLIPSTRTLEGDFNYSRYFLK